MIHKNTSGSTGECLKVCWALCDDLYANKNAWEYRNKWYGLSLNDPYISFHTTLYIGNRLDKQRVIVKRGRNLSFNKLNLDEEHFEELQEAVREHKPVWILAQPSIMNIICRFINEHKSEAFNTIRYIELTGEFLQKPVRDHIQQTFPNAQIVNMYGSVETGVISMECPYGNNHILENNVYMEISANSKSPGGDVVITSLRNTAMPFIRYYLGDRAEIVHDIQCPCGCSSPVIHILAGRTHENITIDKDQYASPYILLLPIETINGIFQNPIRQFQVKQHDTNMFEVDLEIKPEFYQWRRTIKEKYLEIMKPTILGNATWDIQFPKEIPLNEKTGKISFFQNLIGQV